MKKTKKEILDLINQIAGDSPSDEMISLMEDVSDSMYDGEVVPKEEYDANDAGWRKKFADRFSGKNTEPETLGADDEEATENEAPLTYESLFESKED